MRLGIRYRLLVPLALLLAGVVGASLWSARVAARRAEDRVAAQMRDVAGTVGSPNFPLTLPVLGWLKGLSGADFLLVERDGSRRTTFPAAAVEIPPEDKFAGVPDSGIGPPVKVGDTGYRCRRLVLKEPHQNAGGVVYIF